ncbi:efflux RND transporter periplasmic adaptor subunit [Geomonas sp. RF6]|uniref:efflux RND transporter periplasmic adaptor subunit n=1 Tax=Geomonas sp. RF6 TaxID=2897342 RepID=UPI001E50353C|nr:efflux RND transporter periplasmic adaptor subunit [Geomonas sp. RF6]UFS70653.1 efflux RND transporter periplasmic adaptor subunit [Geomonas sp. RF6]
MKSIRGLQFAQWPPSVVAATALGVAALALCGCHQKEKAAAPPPPSVVATTVVARDTPVVFEYVGQTQSSRQVNIQARVSGFLDRRVYTEGAIVKEGDVLFLMDKKPFVAQLNAAKAALARQKAAMETARLNLERTKPLAEKKALSQKDLDDATGTFESSAAAVEMAKAQLETEKLNLSYCTIVSPVTGITGAAMQQDGGYVNAMNSQLTTVAALSPMWVNFSLSENELKKYRDQIASGAMRPPPNDSYEIEVVLVDGSIYPHAGRITFAAPSYNAQTGTFLLRASVDNPKGLLRPNQYVRARVKGATRVNAISVPQRAVQQGAKGHFVWVVTPDKKAESRPVQVGDLNGDEWFISQGLRAGEIVVVDGGMALRPGIPVTVRQAGAEPAAGAPKAASAGTVPATKTN